jgi:CHAD domain-containing protein
MEIESKFLITDETSYQALETLSNLKDYSFSEAGVQLIEDTFLDTEKNALMAEGFYLRLRKEIGKNGQWLTIKSLGGFKDGTHTREEYTCFLAEGASFSECPDNGIKDTIFEHSVGADLLPLLKIEQKRIVRQVSLGEKHIAEFSLDRVYLEKEGVEKTYSELEIELKPEGTPQDLEIITDYLLENHKLVNDPLSKFERAFLFKENLPENPLLSLKERAICRQLAEQNNLYGKQAKILLSLDKGLNAAELSLILKFPEPEIEALYFRFEEDRLYIFPFNFDKKKPREFYFQAGNNTPGINWELLGLKKWTPEALLEFYGIDRKRVEQIRGNALIIFDGLFPYHGLGEKEKELLTIAALLHGIGSSVSPEEQARIGKEILLTHPLEGLKLHELWTLALVIELQSTSINEKDIFSALERAGMGLPPETQNIALILASFIKLLDLQGVGAWNFLPGRIRQIEGAVELEIFGENAGKVAKKMEQKAELFEYLFDIKLHFKQGKALEEISVIEEEPKKPEEENEKKDEKKKKKQGSKFAVKPENPMALVAWRVFSQQFSKMLASEKATLKGEDIEALHDMRVAVRRMRAAAKVFETYLDSEKLEPNVKGLRRTLGSLGDTRDLDVFRERVEEYAKKLPPENEHDLDPLFEVLDKKKEIARENMLSYLNSEKYAGFKKEFSDFLSVPETWALPTTTSKHDALPNRVRDVLPSILYARFSDITAYSEWIEGPYVSVERLHRLRIAAKGLRYTLEFFESVLGEDARILIEELKKIQDHLGNLHDAIVAINLLSSYIETGEWDPLVDEKISERTEFSENKKGIESYLEYMEGELQELLDTFPEPWEKIRNGEFSERIANMVKRLYAGYL